MSLARHDSDSSLRLGEKNLDGSVGGPPPKPMLWVFVTTVLLLVGIIAVSLVNGEGAYGHESDMTVLPRQPELMLDNAAGPTKPTTMSPRLAYADEDTNYASWLLTRTVNPAVNACLDLHAYVCGGYDGAVGRPLEEYVAANTTAAIKTHFLSIAGRSSTRRQAKTSHDSEARAVAFYRSCLKTGRAHEDPTVTANARALVSFLEQNHLNFRHVDGVDLVGKALELLTRYDLQVFFALEVQFFPWLSRNRRFVRVVASPAFEEWKARKVSLHHADFGRFVEEVLSLSGVGRRRIADLTDAVRTIEGRVQETSRADGKPDEATEAAWRRYLDVHSRHVFTADAYDLDISSSNAARFFLAAARVLDGGQRSVYLSWHVARHVAEVARLVPRHSSEGKVDDAKTHCYDQANGEYKHAIMAAHLFKFVNESRLQEVRKMVHSLTIEVQNSISRSSWLPAKTRAKLERKVGSIRWRIGYPAGLSEWKGVDEFYSRHPRSTGVFVRDYLGAREARMRAFLARLRSRVAKPEEFDFANDAPGVTYGTPNEVSVPAVALVWPLFNYRGAPELNYGLLGSLLVEAIMRAFGGTNMMHGGRGSPIPWSANHRWLFKKKYHRCDNLREGPRLLSQASRRSNARVPTSSRGRDLGSRPGVSVGAHALYRAYKSAAASFGSRSVRGFEALRGDQLFHVGRCFLACGDAHDSVADPLFAGHRCNRMARQSSEFAAAFRCDEASRTPAGSRCDFW
ncbi:uncharacterized protein LOC142557351 [Dermacentor variabilis]|uniref:uncharacterized protein LOC142557351 n=1 Tax=Dermacentor variabilis TaxID=34621 RepID=UPI003F5B81A6